MEMSTAIYLTLAILGLGLMAFILIYNSLVSLRNHIKESWSDIDVQLKRRYDLIPNLVNAVKGYAAHESTTMERVIAARNQAFNNNGRYASQATDENQMLESIKKLFAVAEKYPDLKANENFLTLQQELIDTEDKIAAARRFFNGNVRDYNNKTQMFPSNIISSLLGFKPEEFFEVYDNAIRNAIKISK